MQQRMIVGFPDEKQVSSKKVTVVLNVKFIENQDFTIYLTAHSTFIFNEFALQIFLVVKSGLHARKTLRFRGERPLIECPQ